MKKLLLLAAAALWAFGAQAQKFQVFDNTPVHAFGKYDESAPDSAGVLHAGTGRYIFKKVTFPKYIRTTKATVTLTLASNGDRWDKSGSCFLIPACDDPVRMIQGKAPLAPGADSAYMGVTPQGGKAPYVELLRFMTPFGVGHFSDDRLGRKPVYIPFWEKQVQWTQDISQLISMLEGEAWIGIWIDSWTTEGYIVSLDITLDESPLKCDKAVPSVVIPVMNTVPYIGSQSLATSFATSDLTAEITVPKGAKNARLYYITTGHGGHSGGDEFTRQQNLVFVDGQPALDFIPWRDDCASFRRFNPGSGVWLIKRNAPYIGRRGEYETKEIEESLASSDLSRSNWCPGSCIVPESVALPDLTPGTHKITVSIPNAQKAVGDKLNHWLVSAYVVCDL